MLSKVIRAPLERIVLPVGKALSASGLTANMITVAGAAVIAFGSLLVASGRLVLGGLVILAGGLFDTLDGAVARASGSTTGRGGFLDSTIDRFSDGMMFLALAWYFGTVSPISEDVFVVFDRVIDVLPWPYWGLALSLGCLMLAFMTSYMRAKAESLGFDGSAGFVERGERVIILLVGLLFGVLLEALAVLFVLSLATVLHRFVNIWRQTASPDAV